MVVQWVTCTPTTSPVNLTINAVRHDGLTHAGLYVDSDNPTGAVSVYERLGFAVVRRSVTYELIID